MASGLIDVIMSDHNPQDVEVKRLPFAEAAPARWGSRPCCRRRCGWSKWGDRLQNPDPGDVDAAGGTSGSAGRIPARGLARPMSIVIDPDVPWVLDPADLKSQCKNTPFDEARFSGRVVRTIVGGRTVYEHV